MVIERHHVGASWPCPRCKATTEVPANLDFDTLLAESAVDRRRATRLLVTTVVAGVTCCLPLSAFLLWQISGAIHRARDADREVEPLLLSARALAVTCTVIDGVFWLLCVLGTVS